jgi:hypothetical protein
MTCTCDRDPLEPHRDGCAVLRHTYLRLARLMIRSLVPVLNQREGGQGLRRAVQVLGTIDSPARHPGRLAEAGRLLQTAPRDVHAAYLGVRIQAIGTHLRQRRAPTVEEMTPLVQAWQLSMDLLDGKVPNTARHLIPASHRLDRLRHAASRLDAENAPATVLQKPLEVVGVVRDLVAAQTTALLQPAALLLRADQDRNDRITGFDSPEATSELTTAGQRWDTGTFTHVEIAAQRLCAAATCVWLEAPAWPPLDQRRALDLLQDIHATLQRPPHGRAAPRAQAGTRITCASR